MAEPASGGCDTPQVKRRNLFFDLDGTLADPKVGITTCVQYALGKLGRPVPNGDELTWCIGPPLRDSFRKLLATDDPQLIEEGVSAYRERYNITGIFEYGHYDGIRGMLWHLSREGFRLFVVSSKPVYYLPLILKNLDLSSYFSGMYGPDLTGRLDNKAELLSTVLKELGVKSSESVMIGDRKHDVIAGRTNNTKTIAVTWGYGSITEIEEASPDRTCHSPDEIYDLIGGLS